MLPLVVILFVVLLLVFIIRPDIYISNVVDDRVTVEAYDGRAYKVRNTAKKQETALALARLNEKVLAFIKRLELEGDPDYKAVAMRLKARYRPDRLSEGRIDKRYTSYTLNKGEQLVLCLRSRDHKDEIYDDNLIFYVTLHELAHIGSLTEQHNEEFHRNFRYLIRMASQWNLFKQVTNKFHYCGLDVNGM